MGTIPPPGGPSSAAGEKRAGRPRVDWIDSARGAAIVLVILLHTYERAIHLPGEISDLFLQANVLLRQIRMPMFFVCSGILAFWGLKKPWSVVLRTRILVLCWIIFVWTLIYFALQFFMPINGFGRPLYKASQLFIVPFGTLWFIYAILIMSLVMRALMPLRLAWQVCAVVALNAAVYAADKTLNLPAYELLISNLALFAMIYFALGFWSAPLAVWLLGSTRRIVVLSVAGTILYAADLMLSGAVPGYDRIPVALRSLPDVAFGLSMAALLTLARPTRVVFTWLGQRTLELFLFHTIFIALILLALEPWAPGASMGLLLLFVGALLGSVLAERAVEAAGLEVLFRPPGRFGPSPMKAPASARPEHEAPLQS